MTALSTNQKRLLSVIRVIGGNDNKSRANPYLYGALLGMPPRKVNSFIIDLLVHKLISYSTDKSVVIYEVTDEGKKHLLPRKDLRQIHSGYRQLKKQFKGKENKVKEKNMSLDETKNVKKRVLRKKKTTVETVETVPDVVKKVKKKKGAKKQPAEATVKRVKVAPKKTTVKQVTKKKKTNTTPVDMPPVMNGVPVPRAGTIASRVWRNLDKLRKRRKNMPESKEIYHLLGADFTRSNISVNLMKWRTYNGLSAK